jgi:hypothetical protein
MASWSCVLLRVNVLTSQQLHSGFSVNFDFICHFEFTLSGLVTYERQAKILDVGVAAKDSATAKWYEMDPAIGSMVHKPLDNRSLAS